MSGNTNLQVAAVQCQCDQLFAYNSDLCLLELPDSGVQVQVCLVTLKVDSQLDFGEEHEVSSVYTTFLIRATDVIALGVTELAECTKIYRPATLKLEVFESIDDRGRKSFSKHDPYGICWKIITNRCDERPITEWETLLENSQTLPSS